MLLKEFKGMQGPGALDLKRYGNSVFKVYMKLFELKAGEFCEPDVSRQRESRQDIVLCCG